MQKIIRHLFCQPHMARRIVVLILSVTIMGACVSVFDRIQFGTDPASVLNLGVANKLHMLLGTYQMLFYGALLIVVMAMRQWEFIGLGSIANMVLVGYSKDLFDVIFSSMNILNRDAMGMTERICWLVPTLGVFMVAVAFYMVVELGSGPYDAIPQIISKYVKKIPYAVIRMIYDLSAIAIGWLLGVRFSAAITSIDHWIAFVLLAFIGFNMIRESRSDEENESNDRFDFKTMLPLAVATSIDALAVGVTFAFLRVNIVPAVSFIGCITFLLSAIGLKAGNIIGAKNRSRAEFAGGLVLILMGIKILLEHLGVISF